MFLEHEQVRMIRGGRAGVTIIVAVHSTALGPAIGGCRLRHYSTWRDGLTDALRLAAAMTDKCSLAGIDHGGGKTVAVLPADPVDATLRTALGLDVADVIASFNGVYLTGPDVGTGPEDMRIIHERTGYAFCRPADAGGSGDSAQATAHGVLAALLAGVEHVFGPQSLAGRSIGVLGLGNVGRYLAPDRWPSEQPTSHRRSRASRRARRWPSRASSPASASTPRKQPDLLSNAPRLRACGREFGGTDVFAPTGGR